MLSPLEWHRQADLSLASKVQPSERLCLIWNKMAPKEEPPQFALTVRRMHHCVRTDRQKKRKTI